MKIGGEIKKAIFLNDIFCTTFVFKSSNKVLTDFATPRYPVDEDEHMWQKVINGKRVERTVTCKPKKLC